MPTPPPIPSGNWRGHVARALFGAGIIASWFLSHRPTRHATDTVLVFREQAVDLGAAFTHEPCKVDPRLAPIHPQIVGTEASIAACDFDGDGWLDLYTTTMRDGAPNALFRNTGAGKFEDVAADLGLADLNVEGEGVSHGSVWCDVDRDGDQDVFIYGWGRSRLMLQGSDGRFEDHTAVAGLDHWMNCATAAWLDYDRDGWLDLFLGGYYHESTNLWALEHTRVLHEDGEFAHNGGRNFLFRNVQGQRFEDVSDAIGIGGDRWTYGVGAADFDRDGWVDLYVANDYGVEELLLNQGGERFVSVTDLGLDAKSKSGMCVSFGDVTGKGQLCVFVTNITEQGWLFQGNNLRMSLLPERRRLVNLSLGGHGAQDCGWAWGADFGDLDNDGDQDLIVVNGFHSADPDRSYWYSMDKIGGATGTLLANADDWPAFDGRSLSGYQRTHVLLNARDGRQMTDAAEAVGIDDRYDGRAAITADLFNDGTLDVVVANQAGPLLIYRNERRPAADWLGLHLVGRESNPDAVGAHVLVEYGEWRQIHVVTAGIGFCSQTDPRVHVGLGDTTLHRVEITWPSGQVQVLAGEALVPGRYHRIDEPIR